MSPTGHTQVPGGTRSRSATPAGPDAALAGSADVDEQRVWVSLVEADIAGLIAAAEVYAGGDVSVEVEPDIDPRLCDGGDRVFDPVRPDADLDELYDVIADADLGGLRAAVGGPLGLVPGVDRSMFASMAPGC